MNDGGLVLFLCSTLFLIPEISFMPDAQERMRFSAFLCATTIRKGLINIDIYLY